MAILMKRKSNRKYQHSIDMKLECGPMPNVMVALPNIGGTLCSTPQNGKPISAVSGPKFAIL